MDFIDGRMIRIMSFSDNYYKLHHIGRKSRKERKKMIIILAFFYIFDFNAYHTSQLTSFHRNTVNDWFTKMALFQITKLEDALTDEVQRKIFVTILGLTLQFSLNQIVLYKYGLNVGSVNKMIQKNGILDGRISYKKWYSLCLKHCKGLNFLLRKSTTYLKAYEYSTY